MVNKLGDGLQAQALSTLQGLQLFAEQRSAEEQAQWHKHTKALQELIDALHGAIPSEVDSELGASESAASAWPACTTGPGTCQPSWGRRTPRTPGSPP